MNPLRSVSFPAWPDADSVGASDDLLAGTAYGALFEDERDIEHMFEPAVEDRLDQPPVVIHPRLADRRATVERAEFRVRSRRQLLVVGLAVAVLGLLVVWQSGLLSVRNVAVVGTQHTDPDVVRRVAELNGASMLGLDESGALRRIEALPWVASASVERHWPGSVTIRVTEHQPTAVAFVGSESALVAADDRVLQRAVVAPAGLVRIVGLHHLAADGQRLEIRGVGELAADIPASMRSRLVEVRAGDPQAVSLALQGVEIRLGSLTSIPLKLAAAEAVLTADAPQSCAKYYVDVSTPTAAVAGC